MELAATSAAYANWIVEKSMDKPNTARAAGGRMPAMADVARRGRVPPTSTGQRAQATAPVVEQTPDAQMAICVSDLSAFGALMEYRCRGLRLPQDIAIAGLGNYEIAACCLPRITSVDIECCEIGRPAAHSLIQSIQNPSHAGRSDQALAKIRVVEREII